MFTCFGWAKLRTTVYETAEEADRALAMSLEEYVAKHFGGWSSIEFKISRGLNWAGPAFTVMACFNHRNEGVIELFRWIGANGPGSYGLLYVHDAEDHQRGGDYENCFRVWRLVRGTFSEVDDPFLSPLIPTLEDPFDPDRPD